jgi:hypothetical protein
MNAKSLTKLGMLVLCLNIISALVIVSGAGAMNATASSCSAADIQSAVDRVILTLGGTVHIPACQADNTWADGDRVIARTNVTLRIKGAGKDATVIGYQDGARRGIMGFDGSGLVEISDFTFRGSDVGGGIPSGIVIYGMQTEKLRVHDLRIQKFKQSALVLCANPDSYVLVDHNEIGDQFGRNMYGVRVHGTNQQKDYEIPAAFGIDNPNAVFIEDNVFDNCYHSVSAFAVSRVVFRYNTVKNPTSFVDGHGPCYGIGCRRDTKPPSGTYIYEIYNNTIDSGRYPWCINIRGGTGIVTDNTLINCEIGFRLEMESCSAGPDCNAAQGCPHSNTDTKVCYQSPYQWWIWKNDYRGPGRLGGLGDRGTGCIRENQEYYLHAPQPGDPVPGYTKYPYPHPAISGSDAPHS